MSGKRLGNGKNMGSYLHFRDVGACHQNNGESVDGNRMR